MPISVSVIVPVFNEKRSVEKTLIELKKIMKKTKLSFEIIAVDDGSTDNSVKLIKKIKGIKLIQHQKNKGYGASLKTGILASKGKWILIIDADGTYPTSLIPLLIKSMDKYDMVVGSRTTKNVKIPIFRRPAKKILSLMANFLVKEKIPDLNSGLRIFKKDLVMRFFNLLPSGFSFTTTITLCALTNDYNVKYIPIDYKKRVGKSTVSPLDFLNFMNLIVKITLFFEPLRFFLTPGLALILFGFFYGLYQILSSTVGLGQLPLVLILGGLQICFMGLMAELIVKRMSHM